MYTLDLLILVLASIANITIGLFSYLKNYRNLTHKLFALLSISLVGLTTTNYISIATTTPAVIFRAVQMIMVFVVFQNTLFYLFVSAYPGNSLSIKRTYAKYYLIFCALVMIVGIFPGFFRGYSVTDGSISPQPSPLIVFFIVHTVISTGGSILTLFHRYKATKGLSRSQFKFLIFASSILLVLTPLTNFVLPLTLDVSFFIPFVPVYTLLFAALIAYAIVAQKLFDIRAVVARSVAYVLSIGAVVGVYSVATIGVTNYILRGSADEKIRGIISIIFAGILAISFQKIKQFFDRVTNRLFYRNAYDTQEVLDELGSLMVAEIDLSRVINGTRGVLTDALKSSFIEFILFRGDNVMFESDKRKSIQQKIKELSDHIKQQHKDLLVTDELSQQNPLKHMFIEDHIALSLRLKTQQQTVGYILFGEKRSGDIYNAQDEKLLTIVANEMAIAIENALRFEEIQQFNITLQQKVDEATHKLRATNEKLRQLDETKDEFISMASHQLRTPLTSVKGYVDMVLEGDAGKISKMQKQLLSQAFFSSQRMVYLIADLLNVSRLRTGKFIIENKPTQLADVIETELEQFTETARSRHLELIYDKPKDFPVIMLDETKIRQVIMNFVDNAIYYTPAGGHITIKLEDKGESIELTVTDDGLGVPKTDQHHLFTKFYRANNAKRARPDGTGLGLFMAKKVVVTQGGAIIFTSQEGRGSTFGFSFPKEKLKVPTHIKPAASSTKRQNEAMASALK